MEDKLHKGGKTHKILRYRLSPAKGRLAGSRSRTRGEGPSEFWENALLTLGSSGAPETISHRKTETEVIGIPTRELLQARGKQGSVLSGIHRRRTLKSGRMMIGAREGLQRSKEEILDWKLKGHSSRYE